MLPPEEKPVPKLVPTAYQLTKARINQRKSKNYHYYQRHQRQFIKNNKQKHNVLVAQRSKLFSTRSPGTSTLFGTSIEAYGIARQLASAKIKKKRKGKEMGKEKETFVLFVMDIINGYLVMNIIGIHNQRGERKNR